MPTFDFDFQRYVARKKGAREAQIREGAAYAFAGDVRLLRTLDRLRPIQVALEEAGRLWRSVARAELLGPAVRAAGEHFQDVQAAAARCAGRLHIETPTVYLAPQPDSAGVLTLGAGEEVYIVLSAGLLSRLTPDELLDVLGRECGRIQNGHVPFVTALHYLNHSAGRFVRWAVRPATLTLSAWMRRAELTADRAGLLCSRSLDVSLAALGKIARDATEGERLERKRRERALARFAGSQYFRAVMGESGGEAQEPCDAAVAKILEERLEPEPPTGMEQK